MEYSGKLISRQAKKLANQEEFSEVFTKRDRLRVEGKKYSGGKIQGA